MPSSSRPIIERLLSSSRMTTFSPNTVATLATRTSSVLAVDRRSRTGRPAGARFSTMFMPLMILRRLIERGVGAHRQLERLDERDRRCGTGRGRFSSSGSMWMSLARSRIAWLDDAVHQLHDRRLVVEVDLVGLVGALELAVSRLERRDQAPDVGVRAPDLLDDRLHRLGIGGQPLEFLTGGGLGGVPTRLGRIGREHDELAVLLADRDQEEVAGQSLVDPLGELGIDLAWCGCRRAGSRMPLPALVRTRRDRRRAW